MPVNVSTSSAIHRTYSFGEFTLDLDRGALLRAGADIKLRPKSFEVLSYLIERQGLLVTKDELFNAIWGRTVVTEDAITQCLSDIRRALRDQSQEMIRTVPRRGYIFDLPVTQHGGPVTASGMASRSRFASSWPRWRLSAALVLMLGVAAVWWGFGNRRVDVPAIAEPLSITAPHSIAVLPFVNMSSDPEQEYFSDGISEEILNLLAKIPNLKVIGRTSSFAFKGKNEDLRTIGQILGVNTVLEGSVRKSGDRVRITAQLVSVSDGTNIWSESYDRTMTDIFSVQDDVAAAIIDALQIHVGTSSTRGRPTENTEAYTLFLRGRGLIDVGLHGAPERLLLKTIELDPNFAEAYELLAGIYWRRSEQKQTYDAAAKAIAIDPDLIWAQALYQSASIETRLGAMEAAERAVREQPGNPNTLGMLSWSLLQAGYLQEALRLQERIVEIDPLSSEANLDLGYALYAVGRTSEAIAATELVSQLGGTSANWYLGKWNLVEKRDDIAIAYLETFFQKRGYSDTAWVRELVTSARDPATGQTYLDRRIPEIIVSESVVESSRKLTHLYSVFGFLDRHFDLILEADPTDSAWESLSELLVYDGVVTRRLGFTAHPKFLEVAESMGIINIWEQRGPPDFCEKVDDEWVCE